MGAGDQRFDGDLLAGEVAGNSADQAAVRGLEATVQGLRAELERNQAELREAEVRRREADRNTLWRFVDGLMKRSARTPVIGAAALLIVGVALIVAAVIGRFLTAEEMTDALWGGVILVALGGTAMVGAGLISARVASTARNSFGSLDS